MIKRPDWFWGLWEQAVQMTRVSDEFIESALGIGEMLDHGNIDEAKRLCESATDSLRTMQVTRTPGEKDSTQVLSMMRSARYPLDLRTELSRRLKLPLK